MKLLSGIELAGDALKYVVLERRGKRSRLVAWGRRDIASAADWGTCLAALRDEGVLPARGARVAVGTHATHLRVVPLPPMPRGDLERVVGAELRKDLEALTEDMATAWRLLPGKDDRGRQPVLVALTPREGMAAAQAALGGAGLSADVITTSSLALLSHVRGRADLLAPGEPFGALHVGSERMVLALLERGSFRLLRDLRVGLDASVWSGAGPASGQEVDWDALEQISRGLDAMTEVARQVRRTMDYDARQHPARPVKHLLLAGDVTRARQIAPLLTNELQLPVDLLDPLAGWQLEGTSEEFHGEAGVYALPLALAREDRPADLIDLGARSLGRGDGPAARGLYRVAALALAGASLLAIASVPVEQRLDALRAAVHESATSLPPAPPPASPAHVWARAAEETGVPLAPLRWLESNLPPEASLEEVDLARSGAGWGVRIGGEVHHGDPDARIEAWSALQEALERDPSVRDLTFDPLAGGSDAGGSRMPIDGSFKLAVGR